MQRYIEEEVIAALTKSQFRSESRLLTPDTIAEYIASVFWFVIQKWMKYDGDISAGEIVEVYSLLASDSLDEIMQNKIGNLAQK